MIDWKSDSEFSIGDVNFVIDITPGYDRRPSDEEAFTLVKTRPFIDRYVKFAQAGRFGKTVLELGIFQGGSFAFLDQLIKPDAMSAVELAKDPVVPLVNYCERSDRNLNCHFGVSQDNEEVLNRIIKEDLGGNLEMVLDDASHRYEFTQKSFDILFPQLRPGGLYVIEDWAWAHQKPYENPRHGWYKEESLTKMVFELVANVGSNTQVDSIEVYREYAVITKGDPNRKPYEWAPKIRGKKFPSL